MCVCVRERERERRRRRKRGDNSSGLPERTLRLAIVIKNLE